MTRHRVQKATAHHKKAKKAHIARSRAKKANRRIGTLAGFRARQA
jgi:hypothetical protein